MDMQQRPLIWVLKGLRAGDTAQSMALALQLGGRVESKQLRFNASHAIPNWILGARASHLDKEARSILRPPWPDLVVATGRRTAATALWIKKQSGGHSKLVQIGRPRMNLQAFDLVLTTPQYGLPKLENVLELALPFVGPTQAAADDIAHFQSEWRDLRRPLIAAVIGGPKFPVRLRHEQLVGFGDALNVVAKEQGAAVLVIGSPRSPAGAVETVVSRLTVQSWGQPRTSDWNPYRAALAIADTLVVTSDSASMIADMLAANKPTCVYRLPVSPIAPTWSAQVGPTAVLARRGILNPPRNVEAFVQSLLDKGFVGDLEKGRMPTSKNASDDQQRAAVTRIKSLLVR
jgi:uncharacterized protein